MAGYGFEKCSFSSQVFFFSSTSVSFIISTIDILWYFKVFLYFKCSDRFLPRLFYSFHCFSFPAFRYKHSTFFSLKLRTYNLLIDSYNFYAGIFFLFGKIIIESKYTKRPHFPCNFQIYGNLYKFIIKCYYKLIATIKIFPRRCLLGFSHQLGYDFHSANSSSHFPIDLAISLRLFPGLNTFQTLY